MNTRKDIIKWLFCAAFVAASIVVVSPLKEKIRLGLDLAGGTSFTVQIDQEQLREDMKAASPDRSEASIDSEIKEIMNNADERTVEVIRNRIDGLGVNEPAIVPGKDHRIIVEIPGADEEQRASAEKSIKSAAYLQFRLVHKNNAELVNKLFADNKAPEGYFISNKGGRNCYERDSNYNELLKDPSYKRRLAKFEQPGPDYSFMLEPERTKDGSEVYIPSFVRNREEMNGDNLDTADIETNPMTGEISVSLSFNRKGADQFSKITSYYCPRGTRNKDSNEGRQLAIVLDGTLYSAPSIRERIDGGRASISGSFTREDAAILRNILNAGSLPAPIKILEKRAIDASLGTDAIHSGMIAAIVGGGLVILFMLGYYLFYGFVADVAILLDIVLLPLGMILVSGFFSAIGANDAISASRGGLQLPVLTMPGIAGLVLTIGMAVDANVLIYERIREEMNLGKSVSAAVDAGYSRAFYAIFDSNLTTFLTAIILFLFGSGPIRGFAITLSAGIIVSMYTALIVTKSIFRLCIGKRVTPWKMTKPFTLAKPFDFLKASRVAAIFSAIVIVVTIGIFAVRCAVTPRNVMAIDFTGGTVMSYTYEGSLPDYGTIRSTLKAGGIDDAVVQTGADVAGKPSIQIKSGYEKINDVAIGEAMNKVMAENFTENKFVNCGEDTIGSQVGSDLKHDAFWAIVASLIMMIIYITFRFEFGFALGAIVALTHDVLITLGLYSLLGHQFSLTAVACLLTIVGYSVNDTIVIFDRVREDMKLDTRASLKDIVNKSINQTLARTVITSVTTLLAALALLVFGGGAIRDFALCMTIGIIAGTFSSTFIAPAFTNFYYGGKRPNHKAE